MITVGHVLTPRSFTLTGPCLVGERSMVRWVEDRRLFRVTLVAQTGRYKKETKHAGLVTADLLPTTIKLLARSMGIPSEVDAARVRRAAAGRKVAVAE